MNRTETPLTDAAFAAHCPQPLPVLAPQIAVGIARVRHGAGLLWQRCGYSVQPLTVRCTTDSPGIFAGGGIAGRAGDKKTPGVFYKPGGYNISRQLDSNQHHKSFNPSGDRPDRAALAYRQCDPP